MRVVNEMIVKMIESMTRRRVDEVRFRFYGETDNMHL